MTAMADAIIKDQRAMYYLYAQHNLTAAVATDGGCSSPAVHGLSPALCSHSGRAFATAQAQEGHCMHEDKQSARAAERFPQVLFRAA